MAKWWAALVAVLVAVGPARAQDLPGAARKVADALATALQSSTDRAAVNRIAVLPFSDQGLEGGPGARAADLVAARLARVAQVTTLDPVALRGVLGERQLQVLAGMSRSDEAELLALANVKAVVTGQLLPDGGRLRLQVRLSLVPGGKVVSSAQAMVDLPHSAAEPPRPVSEPPRATAEAPHPGAEASRTAARAPPVPSPVAPDAGRVESGSVEVAIRRMADGLAAGFARLPGNARYRRLAVLAFAEVGENTQRRRLGTIVAAETATVLRRDHGLILVEREKIGQVLGELKLQQLVSPDPGQASRIGELADAQALVLGTVAEAGDRYLVTARIVATQTGEALAAESATLPEAALVAVASDAVVLRSRGDAAFRSLLVPGLGQFYNRQPVKGWAFLGGAAALLAGATGFHLAGAAAYDQYHRASSQADATRFYDQASSRYGTRNWLLGGAAALWAVNVVDAWASGVDGEALLGGATAQAAGRVTPLAAASSGGFMTGLRVDF